MKIMIVDDDSVSRRKLAKIIGDLGVCHEYDRGDVALIAFEKALKETQPYHLITLDIHMPELDGLDVLNRIRKLERQFSIPEDRKVKIVMVTANDERDSILSAIAENCTDYIVKPFHKTYILDRFRRSGIIEE